MRDSAPPIITWDAPSATRSDSWHSIVIAMVRALAAIEVAAAHLRALFYPGMRTIADPPLWYQGFAFFTGFAHQAVLLFFVISGWLVGGSLLDKWNQPDAIRHYAVDRITRLWTVLLPVFVLTLLLGMGIGQIDGSTFDYAAKNEFSVASFFGNLAGLQLITVPAFGGNFPLWSLSNETWYYILFPLMVITVRTDKLGLRTGSALAIALLALVLPPLLLLYFTIWLLGAACSRLQVNCGIGIRAALIVIILATSTYCRLTGLNDDLSSASFIPDLILSVLFLAILCSLQNTKAPTAQATLRIARTGRYFAEFSFTLYVIHYPLIVMLQFVALKYYGIQQLTPSNPLHFAAYLAMLCFVMIGAWLSYLLFESRTGQIRNWVKRKFLRNAPAIVVPA
jgi:peptidoglycan/LPS O-acetylase OafA/YrhL